MNFSGCGRSDNHRDTQKAGKPLRRVPPISRSTRTFRTRARSGWRMSKAARATDQANLDAMAQLVRSLERMVIPPDRWLHLLQDLDASPVPGVSRGSDHDGLKSSTRIDSDNYDKDNARDFVLWKAAAGRGRAGTWDSEHGRPGWHLECSAIALRLLGEPPIDIHCRGVQPHLPASREQEIAQSEGATNKRFARLLDACRTSADRRRKMSKSLGNVFTVPDIQAKGYRPSTLRYLLLSTHCRNS